MAYPAIGRNMTRRHLFAEHKFLAGTPNRIIDAVLVGCKAQMAQQLEGLEAKDQLRMVSSVALSMEVNPQPSLCAHLLHPVPQRLSGAVVVGQDLAVIEERALMYLEQDEKEAPL